MNIQSRNHTETFQSPIGTLRIDGNHHDIQQLTIQPDSRGPLKNIGSRGDSAWAHPARNWLETYFAGDPPPALPPLAPDGTPFDRRVWNELKRIPMGTTAPYGDIATKLNAPGAARAVGNACGRNPIPLFIPCHRVIRSDGSPGGYSGPAGTKQKLLHIERIRKTEL